VSHLDAAFGRLLDHLETLGIADRTIVVFTSDHGEMAGVHGIFGKSVMYEEALQTPLIIRHPDGASGTTCRKLVSSVDLMPTILDLLGVPIPTTCEGRSFAAQLRGDEPDAEPEHVFAHYSVSGTQGLADAGGEVCVRTASHKLVASFEDHLVGRPTQLFDLQADRYEEVNLADDEAHGDIRQELLSVLDRWVADVETRIGQPDEAARPSCTARRTLSIG
jgi:arylsulfatase A-like enzyme